MNIVVGEATRSLCLKYPQKYRYVYSIFPNIADEELEQYFVTGV
jgi:hypothetical protein